MTQDDLKMQLQVVADTYGALASLQDASGALSCTFTLANGLELMFPVSADWTPEHVRRYAKEAAEMPLVPGTDKPDDQADTLIAEVGAQSDSAQQSAETLSELPVEPTAKKKRKFFS